MNRIGSTFAVALLTVSSIGAQAAAAQSYLMPESPGKGVWLEASHPNVKAPLEVTAGSSAWFVSGRYPLMSRWSAVAEIPFAYGKLDVRGFDGSTELGNPYLGVEFDATDRVMVELGARAPITTADDESFGDVVGALADPLRAEAFLIDYVPLSGAVRFKQALPIGGSIQARGGVVTAIYTGDEDDLNETTTFLDYGLFGTYPRGVARFGAGLSGRWNVTEDEGRFSDNSMHQIGLSADALVRGMVRPGLMVRVPLESEQRDLVGSTVGFYVQVPLP